MPYDPRTPKATSTHPLSRPELHRLTLFKWRYTLEALGFRAQQVEQLMFLAWLRANAHTFG
jgi:hypothetical protein